MRKNRKSKTTLRHLAPTVYNDHVGKYTVKVGYQSAGEFTDLQEACKAINDFNDGERNSGSNRRAYILPASLRTDRRTRQKTLVGPFSVYVTNPEICRQNAYSH